VNDRLFRAFETVEEKYLRNPAFADSEARHRHVDWLGKEQERIAGEIWDYQDRDRLPDGLHGADAVDTALQAHARAEEVVIERDIIGRLPHRLIHEVRNSWAYREAEFTEPLDPARVDTGEMSTIHWYDRADEARVYVGPVGNPHYYMGSDPIDGVALPSHVHWTEADKKEALEKAVRIYDLEPGPWIELEWPPTPYLWDSGHVYTTDFEPCEVHAGPYWASDDTSICDDCPDCQASIREVIERMAQWKWIASLRMNEIGFDRDGNEYDTEVYGDNAFEVGIIEQDPRNLMIGPPGEGRFW